MSAGPGSAASLLPDIEEARRFLAALDGTAAHWVFQTFDDSDQRRSYLARTLSGTLDRCWPELEQFNLAGAGIFVTVNEIAEGQPRRTEYVCRVRALFVDFDNPAQAPELWPKIDHYGLAPSIVVETSPGKFHAYWLIENCPLQLFKPAQQQLAVLFGTDRAVCDLARVMRLPGFIHQKGTPFLTRLVTPPMTVPCAYNALVAAFGIPAASGKGLMKIGSSASRTIFLPGSPPSPLSSLPLMAKNAFGGLVNLEEIEAASEFIYDIAEYPEWEVRWLLPMAAAVFYAPQFASELYAIFDRVNRRTAIPGKASAQYFADAKVELNKAVSSYRNRAADQRFGRNKIIQLALDAGWDGRTAAFLKAAALNGGTAGTVSAATHAVTPAPFFARVPFDQPNLRPPPWLARGLLLRGETSILAGQGGGAKTALAVLIAVALGAGLATIGPFVVDNKAQGLRVSIMSAEEDPRRLGLLIKAACQVLSLTAADQALVDANLRFHDAQASGWRLGAPRAGQREDMAPEEHDHHLQQLEAALPGRDVLILDTLAALFALPNENDNHAITALMQRLNRPARRANCAVLLLHHTPKGTRDWAASQRGEMTLVRGGGAITNSARVVLTITSPTKADQTQLTAQGVVPDRGRRLDHAKINDMPLMQPAFFELVSEGVRVHDGTEVSVRAVRFLKSGGASMARPITKALGGIVLKAVDAGVPDKRGVSVPLTLGGGSRNAVAAIVKAFKTAKPGISDEELKKIAEATLNSLMNAGCVSDEECRLPQYRNDRANGTQGARGLVAHWDRVPWRSQDAAPNPQQTVASQPKSSIDVPRCGETDVQPEKPVDVARHADPDAET